MAERIQKLLAQAGLGSRRQIEGWIAEGRLQVNGQAATIGQKIETTDRITFNGRRVAIDRLDDQPTRVLLYKKQVGEIVTRDDPEGRKTVFRKLPRLPVGRWITIGRLDVNTSGVLLLTNNGELARRMMHPEYALEREYAVRVHGPVTDEMLKRLREGVELEDGVARFDRLKEEGGEGANRWFHVIVREGRNRLVRRLWESQNVEVSRLIRLRYGPVALPGGVKSATSVELSPAEVREVMRAVGLEETTPQPPPRRRSRRTG